MACLLIGRPNSGKTTFFIHFAVYLGLPSLKVTMTQPQGARRIMNVSPERAQRLLITSHGHTTRSLQAINVTLPLGKRGRSMDIIDSCGLEEGIHPDPTLRIAMAQTIRTMQKASMALHLIDLELLWQKPSPMDLEIYRYLNQRCVYGILANKIDTKGAKEKLPGLKRLFSRVPVFPISALHKEGFKEVYSFVLHHCR